MIPYDYSHIIGSGYYRLRAHAEGTYGEEPEGMPNVSGHVLSNFSTSSYADGTWEQTIEWMKNDNR